MLWENDLNSGYSFQGNQACSLRALPTIDDLWWSLLQFELPVGGSVTGHELHTGEPFVWSATIGQCAF